MIHDWFFTSVRTPGQFPRMVYQYIKLLCTESCSSMPKKQNCQHWISLWALSAYLHVLASDHELSWTYLDILHRRWLQEAKVAKGLDSRVSEYSNAISTSMQNISSVNLKALHWRNNCPLIQKLQLPENLYIGYSFFLFALETHFCKGMASSCIIRKASLYLLMCRFSDWDYLCLFLISSLVPENNRLQVFSHNSFFTSDYWKNSDLLDWFSLCINLYCYRLLVSDWIEIFSITLAYDLHFPLDNMGKKVLSQITG